MKQIKMRWPILFGFCFLLTVGLLLIGCAEEECLHENIRERAVAADCTNDGYQLYECRHCSYSYKRVTEKATGHSFTAAKVEPTCTERGCISYVCHCGYSYETDLVEPLGHDLVAAPLAAVCITEDCIHAICYRCNEDLSDASCHVACEYVTDTRRDLGIPLLGQYDDSSMANIRARCSWDMKAYGGRIYVGSGDYDTNKGPVTVWSYDPETKKWSGSAALADEHVKRYEILDGKLCILGTDPKGDWLQGSYYTLEKDGWQEHRVLPSGIHCFDAVTFGDATFFGLGSNLGDSPAVATRNGVDFAPIPFLKDGAPPDLSGVSVIRVYNFAIFEETLYAFLTYVKNGTAVQEVYRYDGEAFLYHATPGEAFHRGYDITETDEFAGLSIVLKGYCYYLSEDMTEFRPWRVGMSDLVTDMEVRGDVLFVMGYTERADGYETAMYATQDGRNFEKIFYFEDEIPGGSFAYDDGVFYISMGHYYNGDSTEMGRVYAVDYRVN